MRILPWQRTLQEGVPQKRKGGAQTGPYNRRIRHRRPDPYRSSCNLLARGTTNKQRGKGFNEICIRGAASLIERAHEPRIVVAPELSGLLAYGCDGRQACHDNQSQHDCILNGRCSLILE